LPVPGFEPQTAIAVADDMLLESAAPTNGAAVAVLQKYNAGMAGTQKDLGRVRNRLALIKKNLQKVAGFPKKAWRRASRRMPATGPFHKKKI
jgi:hypothetical protein